FLAQGMNRPMHIGIGLFVIRHQGVDHRTRLLCRRRVVQVNEGLTVDRPLQNGKVLADAVDIHASIFLLMSSLISLRTRSIGIRETTGSKNPTTIKWTASSFLRPRDIK